jgi:cell shape-determining protein MreC
MAPSAPKNEFVRTVEALENNIVDRIASVLNEKMDGLDEIVVELIRTKTENETLRQKLNELNKENFSLKSENSSYKSVGLGFYVKKNSDEFMM